MCTGGGVFEFDDGGSYLGSWEGGKAHGFGVCRGPGGQVEFAGEWSLGFETLGVYTVKSKSGQTTYLGYWAQGRRHGLGGEKREVLSLPPRWSYLGEWNQGWRGPLGVRETISGAKYEGTWSQTGQQHGCGCETYNDGGTYRGQWENGKRHGYGVRQSAPYCKAALLCSPRRSSMNSLRSGAGGGPVSEPLDHTSQTVKVTENNIPPCLAGVQFRLDSKLHTFRWMNNIHNVPGNADSLPTCGLRAGFVLTQQLANIPTVVSAQDQRRYFSAKGRSLSAAAAMSRMNNVSHSMTKYNFLLRRSSLLSGLRLRRCESRGSLSSKRTSVRSQDVGPSTGSSLATGLSEAESETLSGNYQHGAPYLVTDGSLTEVYAGEWKLDKRTGYGQSKRSDGLSYEGEWLGNRRHGYGRTVFPDGSHEEGKYRTNELVDCRKFHSLIPLLRNKLREKVERAVTEGRRAALIARQKEELAMIRAAHARVKADEALAAVEKALEASHLARTVASQLAPLLNDSDWDENSYCTTVLPATDPQSIATPESSQLGSPARNPCENGDTIHCTTDFSVDGSASQPHSQTWNDSGTAWSDQWHQTQEENSVLRERMCDNERRLQDSSYLEAPFLLESEKEIWEEKDYPFEKEMQPAESFRECGWYKVSGETTVTHRQCISVKDRTLGTVTQDRGEWEDTDTSSYFFDCPEEIMLPMATQQSSHSIGTAAVTAFGAEQEPQATDSEGTILSILVSPMVVVAIFLFDIGLAYLFSTLFT
ncbi:junctophilin-4-like [Polypterus senegalus]|uniref:junctophilin-4-like n=1 Tax=Polypterus senegalus TaxID=55291 RepID=UPI001965C3BF|nr:junctophilin-4-like [Polypterus senegalus]